MGLEYPHSNVNPACVQVFLVSDSSEVLRLATLNPLIACKVSAA